MIDISKTRVSGFVAAIRGMRNPLESWDKSDSKDEIWYDEKSGNEYDYHVGPFDSEIYENDNGELIIDKSGAAIGAAIATPITIVYFENERR